MADYAKSLVKQYDKNADMMLQADERKELRGRAADSDLNHDGVITIDELVAHLSSSTATSSTTTSSASAAGSTSIGDSNRAASSSYSRRDGESKSGDRAKADADKAMAGRVFTWSPTGNGAATKESDKRRSYRFTRAADRLPTGLPAWFQSRDANGDGQVSMSEYSRTWSSSSVADFRRYDLNDDGIITAKEAAKKK